MDDDGWNTIVTIASYSPKQIIRSLFMGARQRDMSDCINLKVTIEKLVIMP